MQTYTMANNELENKIIEWVKRFIKKFDTYDLIEIIVKKNLSKYNSEVLKKVPGYSNWDFTPDFAIILKKKKVDKNEKEFEIIFINRENKSFGLRSIGEIMSYNKISDPMFSFLISEKGHSNEISYFMINEELRDKLIKYNDKSLILFSFEEDTSKVKDNSVIPSNLKDLLSE